MHTAFISHPDCLLHDMGPYHPERPARLKAIDDELIACGLMDKLVRHLLHWRHHEQLKRVHTSEYITSLEAAAARASSAGLAYLDPDTAMNRYSLRAAYRAAGAVILATELVIGREGKKCLLQCSSTGPSCRTRPCNGFLPVQQYRRGCGTCPGSTCAGAYRDRRFRCASRQWHGRYFPERSAES